MPVTPIHCSFGCLLPPQIFPLFIQWNCFVWLPPRLTSNDENGFTLCRSVIRVVGVVGRNRMWCPKTHRKSGGSFSLLPMNGSREVFVCLLFTQLHCRAMGHLAQALFFVPSRWKALLVWIESSTWFCFVCINTRDNIIAICLQVNIHLAKAEYTFNAMHLSFMYGP